MIAKRFSQIALLTLMSGSLAACPTERFRHEKYQCSTSSYGVASIVLNDTGVGDEGRIIGYNNERKAEITSSSSAEIKLKTNDLKITINRNTGSVTLVRGNHYVVLSCAKSVFTM
jgi:hypothetical protein